MARGRRLALILASGVLVAGSLGAAGCGGDDDSGSSSNGSSTPAGAGVSGEIVGAGASSQGAAQEAWAAGFQNANSGATIAYDPVGSGGGREQFIAGGVDFAGSDSALKDDELTGAQKRCGGPDNLIEIPAYVSPIAIAYNLPGVDGLQLAPATIAKIFKGDITKWNDPAIAADNPDADLPDTNITTVHRSDESGTTDNFTQYLAAAAPGVWKDEPDSVWPISGGEAAQGTSGVVGAIGAGEGTIGYADESQVGDLGVVAVKVGANYATPSAEAAAAILDESPESDDPGQYVFTYDLKRDTTAEGTYPVVLVSYILACTEYGSAQKAAGVKAYLGYITSAAGQQAAAEAAGSAPLSDALTAKITPAIAAIS
ncbi:MAG: phosphate ABC transporter substrate-binding protein PstS [Thermoleophilia bacterium]